MSGSSFSRLSCPLPFHSRPWVARVSVGIGSKADDRKRTRLVQMAACGI